MLFAIKWADIVYLLPMQRPLSGKLKGAGLVHYSYFILKTKVFNFSQEPHLRKIVHYECSGRRVELLHFLVQGLEVLGRRRYGPSHFLLGTIRPCLEPVRYEPHFCLQPKER